MNQTFILLSLFSLFTVLGCEPERDTLCEAGLCDPIDLNSTSSPPGGDTAAVAHCVPALPGRVVLNEVLADPSGADINSDGYPDPYEDEFVELVNPGAEPVDLTGVRLTVGKRSVHTFGVRCLEPGRALVVFGGGTVVAAYDSEVSTLPLRLTNTGGVVSVWGPGDGELDRLVYGQEADGPHSVTRSPDGTGSWQVHEPLAAELQAALASPVGRLETVAHSAGRCVNGGQFPACVSPVTVDIEPPSDETLGDDVPACDAAKPEDLVINEVLADPTGLDANGDGIPLWRDDEFVEVVLAGDGPAHTQGVTLVVNGAVRATLPPVCIEQGEAYVIFGGGLPQLEVDGATALVADKALGLANAGAVVQLVRGETVLTTLQYGKEAGDDQSMTLFPDLTGILVQHGAVPGGLLASPGRCTNGEPLISGCMGDSFE